MINGITLSSDAKRGVCVSHSAMIHHGNGRIMLLKFHTIPSICLEVCNEEGSSNFLDVTINMVLYLSSSDSGRNS